jgi:cell surface protein SprA
MSLNQKTLSDKVRIGEEPISNSMFGIDAKTMLDMPIITDALNTLPFISTKEQSSLTIQGEAAMVMPEGSSKTSTIPSDEGRGHCLPRRFRGLPAFSSLCRPPTRSGDSDRCRTSFPTPAQKATAPCSRDRAMLNWYNLPITAVSDRTVRVDDIWPEKSVAREKISA